MEWGGEAGRGDQEADPKGAGAQLDMQSCLRDQGAETGTATRWVLFCVVFERSEGKLSKEKCESEHERGQLPVGKGLVHGVGGGRGVGLVRTARRRGLGKEPARPHAPPPGEQETEPPGEEGQTSPPAGDSEGSLERAKR